MVRNVTKPDNIWETLLQIRAVHSFKKIDYLIINCFDSIVSQVF